MEKQSQNSYDEINLYELWRVVVKRKWLIIVVFLIFIFLSAIYNFLSPTIYRGDAVFNIMKTDIMTISEKENPITTSKEIVTLLGKADQEKNAIIFPKTYSRLKRFTITPLKNSDNKIMVTIDAEKVNDIKQAIEEVHAYLNNIDFIKTNTQLNRDILAKQSAELSELLVDTPNIIATYNRLFQTGKIPGLGFNPIQVHKTIVDIKIALMKIEQGILMLNKGGIQLAMQPHISSKPVSPRIFRNMTLACIGGFLLAIFSAFFVEYIGNIKNMKNK